MISTFNSVTLSKFSYYINSTLGLCNNYNYKLMKTFETYHEFEMVQY